jgi:Zn-dependent M28 family amino/carboxypeptidase
MKRMLRGLAMAGALLAADRWEGVDFAEEAKRWWSHIVFLASDELEGRDVGSPGFAKAASYVSSEFEKAGLAPGGEASGYFQKVPFVSRRIDESKCSLKLIRDGATEDLKLGEDANIGVRVPPAAKTSAGLVFAGYATRVPEMNYDDFKGLDVKGKIVVYLSGMPAGVQGPLVSYYQSERNRILSELGAAGSAVINNPATSDIPWARATLARLQPAVTLRDHKDPDNKLKAGLTLNPARAERFFDGSGHTLDEILTLAKNKQALPTFPLKGKLEIRGAYAEGPVESMNVVGIKWGSDPALKNEFIVVSAHLDHVGVNKLSIEDKIYNGAMDNASGVASLIETAKYLRENRIETKRSIAFVALTAEEKGLLGSKWYAAHPVFGREKNAKVVADLNMDMYLPLFPLKALVILGVDESTLGDLAKAGAEKAGIEVWPDPAPERNSFIRSDQYSFIRGGIPALAFKFGYKKNSDEEKIVQRWLRERYHSPVDDLEQPVEKEAAAKYNRVLASMVESAANASETPRWKDQSFFKRFAKN